MKFLRTNLPYIILVLLVIGMVFIEMSKPKPINWNPTFSKDDKIPYGNYVLYNQLNDLFPEQTTKVIQQPIYNQLRDWEDDEEPITYLFINNRFAIESFDSELLMEFVERGNTVFIVAQDIFLGGNSFSDINADTFKLATQFRGMDWFIEEEEKHSEVWTEGQGDFEGINFISCDLYAPDGYRLKKRNGGSTFSNFDSTDVQILGADQFGRPNFLKFPYGEGTFYFNSAPFAFTNYNILDETGNMDEYVSLALLHSPKQRIWWDEYYKVGRGESQTPLRYILSNEPLKWLLYMTLLAIPLLLIFEGRRRQRVIPIVTPPKNTTVEFVETLSALYLNKNDHKNLADKKVNYFFDYVRNRLRIYDIRYEEDFYRSLADKSGVSLEETKRLFTIIRNIQMKENVSEDSLILLNRRVDEFCAVVEKIG